MLLCQYKHIFRYFQFVFAISDTYAHLKGLCNLQTFKFCWLLFYKTSQPFGFRIVQTETSIVVEVKRKTFHCCTFFLQVSVYSDLKKQSHCQTIQSVGSRLALRLMQFAIHLHTDCFSADNKSCLECCLSVNRVGLKKKKKIRMCWKWKKSIDISACLLHNFSETSLH